MKNSKAFIFNAAIALALVGSVVPAHAQDTSQSDQASVADAARKARAERKEQPKNAKVFTEDDIPSLKGTINVVGAEPEASAPAAGAAKKPKAGPAATGTGEAYFRQKFAEARRALADDSKELDVLQREFNLKQTQFYTDPNVAMREQYGRSDLNKTQADIDTKKADVAKDQQAIAALEDDLRKAGGDPIWESAPEGNAPAANSPDANSSEANAPRENNQQDKPPQADAPQAAAQTDSATAPADNDSK